jgi:DNA-binding transcriptional regulator YdaS (Cro superfamily)
LLGIHTKSIATPAGTIIGLTFGTIGSILVFMNANPIDQAMTAAGSGPKLGELLGVTGRAVYKWRAAWAAGRVNAIPAERAIQIERAVGVPRHRLRPDLWDSPSEEAA